jgi:hypothetical protein
MKAFREIENYYAPGAAEARAAKAVSEDSGVPNAAGNNAVPDVPHVGFSTTPTTDK